MTRPLLTLLLGLTALIAGAKGIPTFTSTTHDFGNISARGGLVTATYRLTNTGDEPLSIVTVTNGGCHCTRPTFPLQPIRPGETADITVKFDPSTFRGEFNREIKVRFSTGRTRTKLRFSGVVIP